MDVFISQGRESHRGLRPIRTPSCEACGRKHLHSSPCPQDSLLDNPPPASHNGPYSGPLKVRVIPPGVCGSDLIQTCDAHKPKRVLPGQVWEGPAREIFSVRSVDHGEVRMTRNHQTVIHVREKFLLSEKSRWHMVAEAK